MVSDPPLAVSVYPFRRTASGIQFLTLLRSRKLNLAGSWQAVHGRIEPGEKAVEAARRELREETGLDAERFYIVSYVEIIFDPEADDFQFIPVFAAELPAGGEVVISFEHEKAEWCSFEEATRRFIWPSQREAIRRVLEDIAEPGVPNPWMAYPPPSPNLPVLPRRRATRGHPGEPQLS